MTLSLHSIHPSSGAKRSRKRIGRGLSKGGSYSGRGVKGQRARSGGRSGLQLKGLRSLMLSTPKARGFHSSAEKPVIVHLTDLARVFHEGDRITPQVLQKKQLIVDARKPVKILSDGSLSFSVEIEGCLVSAPARKKIEAAGGRVIQ